MIKLVFAICISLFSTQVLAKEYVIEEGKHYANGTMLKVSLIWKKVSKVNETKYVTFDYSALYDLGDNDQHDINKLYGFSDCGNRHHKNSARIGWRPTKDIDKVQLVAYVYNNGKRLTAKHLADVDIFKRTKTQITLDRNNYYFKVGNNPTVSMPRGCNKKRVTGYRLYPYFGGNKTAPHEVRIDLD
jgi:hypothetical protein